MAFNKVLQQINSSPTLALNDKAQALLAQGRDLIHLGIGQPLNDFPPLAYEYALAALDSRQVKYGPTSGSAALKREIQRYTEKFYGRTPGLEQLIVTLGAKQSLANTLLVLLNAGDEVILLAPYWVSYPEMIRLAGGHPVTVPPEQDLTPTLKAITAAVTPRTKAVILNSPNNPSGVVYPPELIAAVVDYCEKEGIYLIMDDIYHQLVFHDQEWVPGYVFTSQPINDSHLIVINGISKSYGMTGFRVGWTVAPSPLIQAMNTIQGHTTSGNSILLQQAALGAMESGQEPVEELKDFILTNQQILLQELAQIPGVRTIQPGGAFYCFPDFSRYEKDSRILADFLLEKAFVLTVPGSAFGMEGHLRMSYTCPTDQVAESVRRIRWALDPTAPQTITIGGQEVTCSWERSPSA